MLSLENISGDNKILKYFRARPMGERVPSKVCI